MPVKYLVMKMKGAFYAGSEAIASSGLKLRKYASLDAVKNMAQSLHLSASSLVFKGVTKGEQKKIIGGKAKAAKKKSAPKRKAAKKKGRR